MRRFKKTAAFLMAAVMVVTMTPITAQAAPKKGKVKSVTIKNVDTDTIVLKKGKSFKLKVKVNVSGKVSKKVTYSSSNKKVATVSKSGKIKAVKKGTAKITVKSVANSKKKATVKVKVGTPVKKVTLDKKKLEAYVGDSVTLKATVSPKKPTIKKVTFSSDKKSVATVNKKGVVTCVGTGTAKITAKAADGSGKKAVCRITVKEKEVADATTEEATTQTSTTEEATTQTSTTQEPTKPGNKDEEVVMGTDLSYEGYKLDWADEFEGTELNREDWNVEIHDPAWVNAELQAYVDSKDNIKVEDGKLVITPIQTKNDDGTYSYTSGRVNTQNKKAYTYGMFEAKVKVPEGMGYLPAFWLMANDENIYGQWPRCGEIDIMEVMGQNTKKAMGTIHYGNPHKEQQGSWELKNGSFSSQYHTFTCEWEPGKITWYVDGNKFHEANNWYSTTEGGGTISYPAPFDQPFYIILNLAVGGSWVGYPDNETFVANPYEIDYVRVYQREGGYDDSNVEKPAEEEVVIRDADENGNYLINGDFETQEDLVEAEGWQFKTANNGVGTTAITADGAIAGKSAVVTTTNEGTVDYSIQLMQNDVPLIAGQTYVLSYDAYTTAEDGRTIRVASKAPERSYYAYLQKDDTITAKKQTFTHEFTMIHTDDAKCTVEFNMGAFGSTDTVIIDNVSLKLKDGKVDEAARDAVYNPKKSVRADGNYIYNGKFEEGNKKLGDWIVEEGANVSVTSLSDNRKLKVVVAEGETVTISQKDVPVGVNQEYLMSMDAKLPEDGSLTVTFDEEEFDVENGAWSEIFETVDEVTDDTFVMTFEGAGTYYVDNVRIDEYALIKNGSFNAGFAGYETFADTSISSKVSWVVDSLSEDNAADVSISDTGAQDWMVQLKQSGVDLEEEQWYNLSFKIKSDLDRKVSYAIQRDGNRTETKDDWTPYVQEVIDITNEYTTVSKDFQMTYDTDLESVFNITMGSVGGVRITDKHRICIDEIMLTPIDEPEMEEIPEGENLFKDPTLTAGFGNGWNAVFDANWSNPGVSEDPTKATGVATMEDGEVLFEIDTLGEFDYSIQLKQENIILEENAVYKATFDIVSSKDRTIRAQSMDAKNAIMYGFSSADLKADEEKTVTVDIDMSERETDRTAYFQISLGKIDDTTVASDVTISNVSLVKISGGTSGEEPGEDPEEPGDNPEEPGDNPEEPGEEPGEDVDVNMLKNADFATKNDDGSFADWITYSLANDDATWSAQDGVMTCNVVNPGTANWNVQLKQTGLTIEAGKTYTFSCYVTSSVARTIDVMCMDSASDSLWYGGSTAKTLAAGERTLVTFTVTTESASDKATQNDAYIQFALGKNTQETEAVASEFVISEVKLVEASNN
ncbi:MAG: glycosyl hydrolase family protein [Lachnospiraceae bacterium]|nr:glycosyl hydrolase family protein [Lachnospiraceae bacterium]